MKTRLLDEFRTGPKEVPLKYGGKELSVWVRRPNTPEKQLIEQYARIASRDLRKALDNPKSKEHQTLVKSEIASYERQELELIWMAGELFRRTFEFERQTLEDRDQTFVPEPQSEDAIHFPSQAEIDHHETEVEKVEGEREEAVKEAQANIAEQLKVEAEQMTLAALRKNAVPRRIDQLCGAIYNEEYTAQLVARCTFEDEDEKRPMFKTVSEVRLFFRDQPEIAQQVSNGHQSLMVNPEEAKN